MYDGFVLSLWMLHSCSLVAVILRNKATVEKSEVLKKYSLSPWKSWQTTLYLQTHRKNTDYMTFRAKLWDKRPHPGLNEEGRGVLCALPGLWGGLRRGDTTEPDGTSSRAQVPCCCWWYLSISRSWAWDHMWPSHRLGRGRGFEALHISRQKNHRPVMNKDGGLALSAV